MFFFLFNYSPQLKLICGKAKMDDYDNSWYEQEEQLTYEQLVEGYEDSSILIDSYPSITDITLITPIDILLDYLIATSQTCFIITYQNQQILGTGFVDRINGEHKLVVNFDDENLITSDPRQAVDTALTYSGNTPLSFFQYPLDYIYIAGCGTNWARMLQQLTNLSYCLEQMTG